VNLKKPFEYVEGKRVDVNEVEIEMLPNDSSKIARIKLKTNEGIISFKPYREIEELSQVQGYKLRKKKQELLNLSEMPLQIHQINEAVKKQGLCKVKLFYTIWKKMVDNNLQVYRYMRNNDIEKLQILEMDEKIKI
jgi:hypothetical protein